MGQGASLTEIKAFLSISNDLYTRLLEEDKEFSVTIKKGLALSHAWWEKLGRENLFNKDFSATLWYMNMKNRFNWRDRQEVDATVKQELSLTALYDAAKAVYSKKDNL